jgi:signal transduction histidine kinase/ligand-binding sensor domain-containing protein
MWYAKKIIFLLFWGIGLFGFSQPKTQFQFHHLSREDGLILDEKTFIYKDSYGLTWLNSRQGLNCYNGHTLKTFEEIGDKSINSPCFEDKNGDLWFSTFDAVYCYQRKSAIFLKYILKKASFRDYHAFHLDKSGILWLRIGTGEKGHLYHFNTREKLFKALYPLQGERCYVISDSLGEARQIISTDHNDEKGLLITDVYTGNQKRKQFFHFSNGNPIRYPAHANTIYAEGDSVIWVSTYDGIGVYYPKRDTAWVEVDINQIIELEGEEIGEVWDIVPYGQRYLLASTEEKGLLLFDKQLRQFVAQVKADFNNPTGLKTNFLKGLFLNRDRELWIVEVGMGLAYAQLNSLKFEQVPSVKGQKIEALFEDNAKNIWCSTLNPGIYVFDQQVNLLHHSTQFDIPSYQNEAPLPPFLIIFQPKDGSIWATYLQNLLRWNFSKKKFYLEPQYILPNQDDDIKSYFGTKDGKSLVAIRNTIDELRFSGVFFTHHPFLNFKAFHLQNISTFFQDTQGYYYIADNYHRLLILKEKNGQLQKILDLDKVGECYTFYEAPTKIWIASSRGLFSLDKQMLWTTQKSTLEAAPRLPHETFYAIIPHAGYLWLTGNNGLIRYHPAQKHWDRFSQADGLQSQEFTPRAWIKASDGKIWLGGPNGLNVFHPDSIKNNQSFPPLMIEHIKVNDLDFKTEENIQLLQKIPNLRYQDNTLSFDFLAIEYNDPEAIQLKYRLRGQDETWVETPNPGFVRFSKLPPGAYTLEVISTNSDGIWMPKQMAKQLSFFILTPWYRTWWFYLLCISTITAIAYGIFNYRLQQALKIERIRVRISSDLHDDVGTLLSGLAMQSEILELTAPEKTKPKLQRISELSRSAMSRMRDTVWAIDARKDKLENLIDRMREHAEETLIPKDILLALEVDQLALSKNVPSQIRQALYLIYKEAITNCAKHSKGDKVSVRLQKFGPKGLEMSIHDNGEVQQKAYKTTGLGLSNMRMRAEQVGGTFQVDTSRGFLITVQIPHFS